MSRNEQVDELKARIKAMQQIGRALSSTLDLDTLLSVIMTEITRLMAAERSTLFLVDKAKKEIWSKVLQGSELKEIRLPIGQGIAGSVASTKKLERIDDAYKDSRFDRSFDKRSGFRTRSIICSPIFDSRKQMLGVIQVLNHQGGPFTDSDEQMITALASQIAVAVENAQLYRKLEMRARVLEQTKRELERANVERTLLFSVERQLARGDHVDQVFDGIIEVAMKALSAEAGSLLLIDEKTNELFFKSALGEKGEEVKRLRLKLDEGIVGHVARTGKPLLVNDALRDQRHKKAIAKKLKFVAQSIVCAPLMVDGKVVGAIEILNKMVKKRGRTQYVPFDNDDVDLLVLLAGQAARTIEEAKRRAEEAREERLHTIGQALSGVVHDFRSPMTVIGGYAEICATEENEEKRREFLSIITQQIDHVNGMVGELLAFSRGETTFYQRKVFVNRFVQDLRDLLAQEVKTKNAELTIAGRYDGAAIFDPIKITRVLTNLVRNALEAGRDGTMKIHVLIDKDGDDLVFSVRDNGPGVPDAIADKLFESFVTSGKKNGTGLGLALSRRLIEEHGGAITFASKKDKGTTFTFALPRAAKA